MFEGLVAVARCLLPLLLLLLIKFSIIMGHFEKHYEKQSVGESGPLPHRGVLYSDATVGLD